MISQTPEEQKIPFASSEVEMRLGSAFLQGVSTSLDTNGFGQRSSQKALYAAAFINASSWLLSLSVMRKNQPSPSGSLLTSAGSSSSWPLPSVTVPSTGA